MRIIFCKVITDRQVLKFLKAFAKTWSTNIKLSKTQLAKIAQSVDFLADSLDHY